jgi:hypothetical protein
MILSALFLSLIPVVFSGIGRDETQGSLAQSGGVGGGGVSLCAVEIRSTDLGEQGLLSY